MRLLTIPLIVVVCGVEHLLSGNGTESPAGIIPIAGSYTNSAGRSRVLDPTLSRLKSSDSDQEGLSIELHGGKFNKRKQQAVINFICDRERSGLDDEDKKDEKEKGNMKRDDKDKTTDDKENDDESPSEDDKRSLRYKSYGPVDDVDVLRLDWLTKYACEGMHDEDGDSSGSWGFFTWLIIM